MFIDWTECFVGRMNCMRKEISYTIVGFATIFFSFVILTDQNLTPSGIKIVRIEF